MDRSVAMRQAIAAAAAKSKHEIPHHYLWTHLDLHASMEWLEARNAEGPMEARILPAALMLKATALALRDFPQLNGFWTDGAFRPAGGINPGVAVFLRGGGLVAPAILDADRRVARGGDDAGQHHRHQPGGPRRGGGAGRHPSPAGGPRRLRPGHGPAVGDGGDGGCAPARGGDAGRRPPRQRLPPRQPVPGEDRRTAAEPEEL